MDELRGRGRMKHVSMEIPKKRNTWTYELVILSQQGRFKVYLAVGLDAHGKPIELWLDCAKEGATLKEFMHAWASLFSIALQGGIPLRRLIPLYKTWRFEPCGKVEGFEGIKTCESILALIVSVLELEFPKEAAGAPKDQGELFA